MTLVPAPANGTAPGINDDLTTIVRGARAFVQELAKLIQEVGELRVKSHNLAVDNSALLNTLADLNTEIEELRGEQSVLRARVHMLEQRGRSETEIGEKEEAPLDLVEETTPEDSTAFVNKFLQTLLTTPREWYHDDGRIPPLLDILEVESGKKRVHTLTPETAVFYQQFSRIAHDPDGSLTVEEWKHLCESWGVTLPFPFPMIDTEALRVACGLEGTA